MRMPKQFSPLHSITLFRVCFWKDKQHKSPLNLVEQWASLVKVALTSFNHNELEMHRSSLNMPKIWKDCMSFNGAQPCICQTLVRAGRCYALICLFVFEFGAERRSIKCTLRSVCTLVHNDLEQLQRSSTYSELLITNRRNLTVLLVSVSMVSLLLRKNISLDKLSLCP